jgi:hypothetical protein
MGNMLQQIVAPLHDLGMSHDAFIPVRLWTTLLPIVYVGDSSQLHALL